MKRKVVQKDGTVRVLDNNLKEKDVQISYQNIRSSSNDAYIEFLKEQKKGRK